MQKLPNGILQRQTKKKFTAVKKKFKVDFDSPFNFLILKENQKVFEMVLSFLDDYYNGRKGTFFFMSIKKDKASINDSRKILTCASETACFIIEEEDSENNEIFVSITMIY